jgi:hypothetical protein
MAAQARVHRTPDGAVSDQRDVAHRLSPSSG